MFKEKFIRLCNDRGEYPSAVCKKIGITPSAFSQWTDDTIPRRATLIKIADYFGVSVAYLLDVTDDPDPKAMYDPEKKEPNLREKLTETLGELTEEELSQVEHYLNFLLSTKKK